MISWIVCFAVLMLIYILEKLGAPQLVSLLAAGAYLAFLSIRHILKAQKHHKIFAIALSLVLMLSFVILAKSFV